MCDFIGVEVVWAHSLVVTDGVILCEVVALIGFALPPQYMELFLVYPVTYPVEPHVHCLGPALFDCPVGNAGSSAIVGDNNG